MAETPLTRYRAVASPTVPRSSGRPAALLLLASLPMLVFLAAPLAALILRSAPAQLLANVANPEVAQAIGLSVSTTALTVALAVIFGTPLAYLLAHRRFRGRTALDTLIDLPMVLPPSVAGIALLVAFGRRGLLGQYFSAAGLDIAFTQTAVVLAQTFVAAPFYIKAAIAGFASIDQELEQAAAL
ncbi:MAG TPA: ABC transporter permease subunit, partial [Roseiflexaceae bacterium]